MRFVVPGDYSDVLITGDIPFTPTVQFSCVPQSPTSLCYVTITGVCARCWLSPTVLSAVEGMTTKAGGLTVCERCSEAVAHLVDVPSVLQRSLQAWRLPLPPAPPMDQALL